MGQIANTDAQFLSQELNELGIGVYYHTVVGDNPGRLKEQLRLSLSRSDIVITTGGLGPTEDDLTKETVAEYFGLAMVRSEVEVQRLAEYFSARGKNMTPNNLKQADFPEGSVILPNPNGTAPGCLVEQEGRIIAILPGPPRELQPIFTDFVKPILAQRSGRRIVTRMLHIVGVGESEVEYRMRDLIHKQSNPTLATYLSEGEIQLRITASCDENEDAAALLNPVVEIARERFGSHLISTEGKNLPHTVLNRLLKAGKTVAAAESCTGGLLSSAFVDLPGSSEVFLAGAVTYANSAKMNMLGVPREILEKYGAVSEECARAMAENVRKAAGSDFGLSTTGIAGPGGGTAEKPVGLVYVGLAWEGGCRVQELHLKRDRSGNRRVTVQNALMLLLEEIR